MDADLQILEHLEPVLREATADEAAVMIALIARDSVSIAPPELASALRRALLVFAAGGDLQREPSPDDPAVVKLAGDLASPERRAELDAALRALGTHARQLPAASTAVEALLADGERAWRALACAILADELGGDDDDEEA